MTSTNDNKAVEMKHQKAVEMKHQKAGLHNGKFHLPEPEAHHQPTAINPPTPTPKAGVPSALTEKKVVGTSKHHKTDHHIGKFHLPDFEAHYQPTAIAASPAPQQGDAVAVAEGEAPLWNPFAVDQLPITNRVDFRFKLLALTTLNGVGKFHPNSRDKIILTLIFCEQMPCPKPPDSH